MAAITPGTVFNKKQANARNIDWVKVLAHIILISGSIVFLMPLCLRRLYLAQDCRRCLHLPAGFHP